MGVKDLWHVVSPVCEKKSLWELRNKTVAIDLSAWVCDSQFATKSHQNMYLRNLFFRTAYLLQIGVNPIFVLEGPAPKLKSKTICKRLKKDVDSKTVTSRNYLNSLQKQCTDLLSCLGITCIKAPGEAEAFCSHLNLLGLACGVVTQDSDAFLYGATEVYRHFQLSPNYTCDVYKSEMIEAKLGMSRTKMVAFSLLTGSDYTDGVHNIGKESAIKFLKNLRDEEIFERFESWVKKDYFSRAAENKYSPGNALEMAIREKALRNENFPCMEVVEEYLREPEDITVDFQWKLPDIPKFISLAARKLCWDEDYAGKKILPLVTRWHLVHNGAPCGFRMTNIVKKRNLKGSAGYEVEWEGYEDFPTVEDKHLVDTAYPDLVNKFEESKKKKPKEKEGGRKKRKKLSSKEDEENFGGAQTQTLDKFIKQVKRISVDDSDIPFEYDESELNLSNIVQTIISRPNSNPAVEKLKHFL